MAKGGIIAPLGHRSRGTEVARHSLNSTGWTMSDGRLETLRRDIEARIRPIVPDLSNEEFEALIERMAQLQYKYEARRADDFFERRGPDSSAAPAGSKQGKP